MSDTLSSAINATVSAAPELAHDPGTVVAVAQAGGSPGTAQAVAQGMNRQANATGQQAVAASGGGGLFGDIGKGFSNAIAGVAHAANVGLATVQQEYRYLHDVEARHGMGAALLEGAGIVGGAALGTVLDPGEGTVLGAEAAARVEGQFTYKDSWQRAANPNYRDPHTGQLVSFGRDVASAIGVTGGAKTAMSGVLDGIGDLVADPLANVGKGLTAAHSLEGMGGVLGQTFKGTAITAENVDQAYRTLPSFRRAASDIAGMTEGDIAVRYPQFNAIAPQLAAADTGEKVAQVFKEVASSNEILDSTKLPTLALTRMPFRPLRDAVRNAGDGPISEIGGPVGYVAGKVANNAVFGPRRWADRLEALPGKGFDPEKMDLSGSQINPANTRGNSDLYAMVRYADSDNVARSVVDAYSAATPAQRIVIVKNATMKMLFAMAHMPVPEDLKLSDAEGMENYMSENLDGKTKAAISERLDNHLGAANIEGTGAERTYGMGADGKVVRPVMDDEGVNVQGAVRENQTGNISIPNIVEARRMAAAIRSSRTSRFLQNTDDFLYNHVTQGFFKPLVLMSGGYGLHISMAEAIPNTLRHGVAATVGGMYDRVLANLGLNAWERDNARAIASLHDAFGVQEKAGVLGWLYDVAGARALENRESAQYLMEAYIQNEGYKTTPGVAAGEMLNGEIQPVEKAVHGFRQTGAAGGVGTKEGADFARMTNAEERFPKLWQASLREASNSQWTRIAAKSYRDALDGGKTVEQASEAARKDVADFMRTQDPDFLSNYVRQQYKSENAPVGWDAVDDHAGAVVDALKGDVHGQPEVKGQVGKLHEDLLGSIINGRAPTLDEVKAIPQDEWPLAVKGRQVVPDGTGSIQRIANFGFRKILNPMVNIISRNQEYAVEYVQARKALQANVDAGVMSEDQAATQAAAMATTHTMRFVHNLHDRTQWTATMRNWAPFYFAQEQAYRRMGRLLAEDPGAFRRYQLMISGVHDLATNVQDSNGNKYIAFPGSGYLGSGVADIMGMHGLSVGGVPPAAFGGSFSSANVVFPMSQGIRPDLGPVALIPIHAASSMFSELGKTYGADRPVTNLLASSLADVAGSQAMSQSTLEQIIPNAFVSHMVEAFGANDRAFNSSIMQAYQLADYQQTKAEEAWVKGGRKGPEPHLIPLPTDSAMVKQQFVDKIRNMTRALYIARAITGMVSPVSSEVVIQNFGFPAKINAAIAKEGSVSKGMTAFLADNPDAVPYITSQSYVPSDVGGSTPSGISLASSQPAMDWVDQNQALISKYGNAAMWLMPQLTDSKYSPTVYNEQLAQGLRVKDTPDQFLTALYTAAGDNLYYAGLKVHEDNLAVAGNSTAAKNDEYNAWNAWVSNLQQQNPVWANQHFSAEKQTNTQQTIQKLTQMFNSGDAPAGPQSDAVRGLLQDYQTAAADYAAAGQTSNYQHEQTLANDSWISYLDSLETSEPALKPIITTIFKGALKVRT